MRENIAVCKASQLLPLSHGQSIFFTQITKTRCQNYVRTEVRGSLVSEHRVLDLCNR